MGAVPQIGIDDKGKPENWLAHEEVSKVAWATEEEKANDKCSAEEGITHSD